MKLITAIKLVFSDPDKYAYQIKNTKKIDSLIFLLKSFALFTILSFLINIKGIHERTLDAGTNIYNILFTGFGFYLALAVIITFLSATILHACTKIFGSKEKFSDTFAIYCYGLLPYALISWIPFISLVGVVYTFYIQIVALKHGHYFKNAPAISAYILHFIIVLIIAGIARSYFTF